MFVFYDTETTGLDKDFTQILQIGLLFTDDDLNVLSSKKVDGRHSPWDVPSPGALLTTGFKPEDLKKSKNSNFEMMHDVNRWLRGHQWPLTFIGYNSIGYDEAILAQNFYQSLLPHDLTTSKNFANVQLNGRADVMIMVQMISVYMKDALKLDIKNKNGSSSMTLKNVALQNGIALSDKDAHDALNDIKATVGVAKVVQKVAPQIWEQAIKLSTVGGVNKFLDDHDVFTFVRFMYGNPQKTGVMTSLVEREGSATQALFDLSFDPAPYLTMTPAQLKEVFLSRKDSPFVLTRKDEQPVLMPIEQSDAVLTEKDNIALYKKRAKLIKANKVFLDNVAEAALLAKKEEWAAEPDTPKMPETMMHRKISAPVQAKLDVWAKEFRDAESWPDRAALTGDFQTRFRNELASDPSLARFQKLAERIVFEHAPTELTAARQLAMNRFIANRILNPDLKVPYMTIAKARRELFAIESQRAQPDNDKWKDVTDTAIRRLKLYYTAMEKEYASYALQPPAANNNAPAAQTAPVKKPAADIKPK